MVFSKDTLLGYDQVPHAVYLLSDNPFMVMKFASLGRLDDYLLHMSEMRNNGSMRSVEYSNVATTVTSRQMVLFGAQVARGLHFVHDKHVRGINTFENAY